MEDGSPATIEKGIYNHHTLTRDTKKLVKPWISRCDTTDPATELAKEVKASTAGFLGTGEDNGNDRTFYTSRTDTNFEGGYWIGENDEFMVQLDLVNYNDKPVSVYATMDLEYLPGNIGANAVTRLLSVTGCGKRKIALDKTGRTETKSDGFVILEDGDIMYGKGHMHDGGVEMQLFVNDQPVCTSKATYGGEGGEMEVDGKKWETISGMGECGKSIPVKKGDSLKMSSVYDLAAHPLREGHDGAEAGVMGMWSLGFAASGAAQKEGMFVS
ncbi:hypothetical protein K402DRAFT_125257 [Aulographum hederae CBS 113979]|uniref:Uncharacterized protein n=1 Tax=Aulographum hederae CBS 113979 TaxID=1176131 RepID=A0A6G1HEI5_9PEZI|nr:hypothetical protein K402DRAFT_125257 [Aulographum hederae CBS 113979]